MSHAINDMMPPNFTKKIMLALGMGALTGFVLRSVPMPEVAFDALVIGVLDTGGLLFINLLRMLVVPVVFVSLVCGVSSIGDVRKLGRIGVKTLVLYLLTTFIALILGLLFAFIFQVGKGANLLAASSSFTPIPPQSIQELVVGMIPHNPVSSLASGNLLQIIIFSLLLGMSLMMAGKAGESIRKMFTNIEVILQKLVYIVMVIAPYGVFCLLAALFAKQGFNVIINLFQYFFVVMLALFFQLFVIYSIILISLGRLNPVVFFKKMYTTMLFAFSISSSNAAIPVVLDATENKLGVHHSIAAFVIPLGATINMDGTAIMQSIATIFIAHAYQIDIGMAGYLTIIMMAMMSSIGTAGVPSVGLITLTMVLQQVGLPTEGIALIIGVDRLLDMLRTAVNISGDAVIACLVAGSEGMLSKKVFNSVSRNTTIT